MALPWLLFDNVKAVVRVNVLISSLFGLLSTEFVTTTRMASEKLGSKFWSKLAQIKYANLSLLCIVIRFPMWPIHCVLIVCAYMFRRNAYFLELLAGIMLLACAALGLSDQCLLRLYLGLQSTAFILCAFDISL